MIDPDGEGPISEREVWCEQDRRTGGWALALKIDGESPTFAGTSSKWRDAALFQPENLDPQAPGEAKLAPYVDYPVAEVMLVIDDQGDIVLPLRATSLQAALASELAIPTRVPEVEWRAAFGATSLETGCRRQGFGISLRPGVPGVRIGLVANQEPDECRTPESFIGVGGNILCSDGTLLAAGTVSSANGDRGVQCTPARVLVFVRDDDRTYHSALPSCAAHFEAGRRDNGIYQVGDPAVPRRCEMTIAGGGWTNALDVDSLRGCPDGWKRTPTPTATLCVHRPAPPMPTIAGITITSPLPSYREVMVSVLGFQFGSTDGFYAPDPPAIPRTIDDAYLDGLSITTAETPRRHIASYAVGITEDTTNGTQLTCPCLGGGGPPPFASEPRQAWRCESGSLRGDDNDLHVIDPLFDGVEVPSRVELPSGEPMTVHCEAEASADPILANLDMDTSVGLEARLMVDEPDGSESLAVYRLELWVR